MPLKGERLERGGRRHRRRASPPPASSSPVQPKERKPGPPIARFSRRIIPTEPTGTRPCGRFEPLSPRGREVGERGRRRRRRVAHLPPTSRSRSDPDMPSEPRS
jgi:hypothetical protein